MKTILKLVLIACLCPLEAWAFGGSSDNYQLDYCIEGLGVAAGTTANYQLRSNLLFQPVGLYETTNYKLHLGPYFLAQEPGVDTDGDGIEDTQDNCPEIQNSLQEDTYPPLGNECGNACECEGNFDNDLDVDGTDASTFKLDFGRSKISGNPCSNAVFCNGDFECDTDVDGTNASQFKSDFGRSKISGNPCPICPTDPWCVY